MLTLVDENPTDNPDSFKWYYKSLAGMQQDSILIYRQTDTIPGRKTIHIRYPMGLSRSLSRIETFYLKRSATATDTVFFDVSRNNNPCEVYTVNAFTFNGKNIDYQPVYVK
jgi:hypothetical protein